MRIFAGVVAAMIYFVFIGVTAIIHGSRYERGGVKAALYSVEDGETDSGEQQK